MKIESVKLNKDNYSEFEKRLAGTGLRVDAAFVEGKLTGVGFTHHGREIAFVKVEGWSDLCVLMPEVKLTKMWLVRASMLRGTIHLAPQWFSKEEEAEAHKKFLETEGLEGTEATIELIEREEDQMAAVAGCMAKEAAR